MKLYKGILLLLLITTGCSFIADQDPLEVNNELPIISEAPELTNEIWINSDRPLRLADLKGKVVLLEMWTFG
jgi:hypothetical protein